MSDSPRPAAATLALHAGYRADTPFPGLTPPLHGDARQAWSDLRIARERLAGLRPGHADPRQSQPTCAVLEERLAALEGGVAAVALASAPAALQLAITTLMESGAHIVAAIGPDSPYYPLLAHQLPRLGIRTSFVPVREPAAWRGAIRPETRLFFGATLSPTTAVLDIPAFAALAHDRGMPLLVDATWTVSCAQQPLSLGADLVLHDAAPMLAGDPQGRCGILIDGGRFDWWQGATYPALTTPQAALDGRVPAEESPLAAFTLALRGLGLAASDLAATAATARTVLDGLATLPLRTSAQTTRASALASWLSRQPQLAAVDYPDLPGHPDHALTGTLLADGAGPLIHCTLNGGAAATEAFLTSLQLIAPALHPGGLHTLACFGTGTATTITLSVGLENLADLQDDLARALRAAEKAVTR